MNITTTIQAIKASISRLFTFQTGTPVLQGEHPLAVLFPGLKLLVMGGSHGVQLPVPVLQLSHQQLELPPLLLDGRATQVIHRKLLQNTERDTHHQNIVYL